MNEIERYRKVIEAIPEPVALFSEGKVVAQNRAFEEMEVEEASDLVEGGTAKMEFVGRSFFDVTVESVGDYSLLYMKENKNYGLLHDVRNVVNTLSVYDQLVSRGVMDLKENETREKYAKSIHSAVKQLKRLCNGNGDHCESIAEEVAESIERVDGHGDTLKKAVTLKAEYEKDFCVYMAPVNVGAVLDNVCLNAVQASKKGGKVAVKTCRKGSYGVVEVRDWGEGLENAEKAFELGYTTKKRCGGSGVGLARVKKMMESSGGYVKLVPMEEGCLAELGFRVEKPE